MDLCVWHQQYFNFYWFSLLPLSIQTPPYHASYKNVSFLYMKWNDTQFQNNTCKTHSYSVWITMVYHCKSLGGNVEITIHNNCWSYSIAILRLTLKNRWYYDESEQRIRYRFQVEDARTQQKAAQKNALPSSPCELWTVNCELWTVTYKNIYNWLFSMNGNTFERV